MRQHWRDESGQSMILVAIAAVVLLGALALAIDWGYGLTQRRVMQTASDSAALAVGRYLATSVIEIEGSPAFSVTTGDTWYVARRYVEANDAYRTNGATVTFRLQLGAGDPVAWIDVADPSLSPGASYAVPSDVRYARVTTTITYHALVSGILGFPTTTAAASARAKIAGTGVPAVGPVWPMVRHFDPNDFDNPCPPGTCDPTDIEPMTFWSPNEDDMVYGNFKGLVDFSRYSSRQDGVAQLLTEWDESGSRFADPPTPLKADQSGNCGGLWDTQGGEDPQLHGKQCSIPNWFYYAFEGRPSLDRPWMVDATAGQESPTLLSNGRAVCSDADRPDPAPSCDDRTVGDWVETAFGDIGTNMSNNMKRLIHDQGFVGPYSDQVIATGPNKGEPYGKALVVIVYLWDCAESFDASAPQGQQWNLILPRQGTDCSQIPRTGNAPAPDRVHLFTVAPFTFYEGLVSSQAIQGYWGGGFGDPRACTEWVDGEPTCDLNPLSNTAVLVGDD